MTPISKLIENLKLLTTIPEAEPLLREVRVAFSLPTLHIDLVSDAFRGFNDEDRLERVTSALAISFAEKVNYLQDIMSRLPITISALTIDEANNKANWLGVTTTSSWVNWFLDKTPPVQRRDIPFVPRYVHFYGYKGGQARSTILALFGKMLADDGYRVLVIDADTEAPSLDSLLSANADNFSQTLMGLCGWSDEFKPIPAAYTGQQGSGRIDVLPCRPRNEDHDLDFALLVATAPLDARIYERAATSLRAAISKLDDPYDFVLLDHRTGIATSVLPLVNELPGSTVIFARNDANTASIPSEMKKVVRSIFESSGDNQGAFVSFSLDSTRKSEAIIPLQEARAREELLFELAGSIQHRAYSSDSEDENEEISPQELAFNWVDWYLDRALLDTSLPDISKLQSDNVAALQKLRSVLGLPIQKRAKEQFQPTPPIDQAKLSVSGARDQGTFIHIPDIERLFIKGSPLTYILGRKGTGKTRLLKELVNKNLGIPVLVAADEIELPALRSQSAEAQELVKRSEDASTFWWRLIRLAIQTTKTLPDAISESLSDAGETVDFSNPLEIKKLLLQSNDQKVLLIDGLETLVPAAMTKAYVSGLFAVMNMIQNDPVFSSKLVLRVFLREDLTSDSVQNIEQQMEGRVLRLKWSASSILNFALSRIPQLPWISKNFQLVSNEIESRSNEIRQSAMPEQEATALLLRVFPDKLRRNNLLTSTFLRLYFSDAGGDNTNMATFYPRLYLSFLQKLDALAEADSNPISEEDERLNSALLNRAYDDASSAFIEETKQELVHLLSLAFVSDADSSGNDQSNVTKFISAFEALSTPFAIDKIVSQLQEKTPFTDQSIRESLRRMKALRMFEERPGYPGWWRVGQLYKMGLRMKYAR